MRNERELEMEGDAGIIEILLDYFSNNLLDYFSNNLLDYFSNNLLDFFPIIYLTNFQ
jgi:hypothetical protein